MPKSHHQLSLELHDILERSRRVLLATHERADGDALGSLLAVHHYLRRSGREVTSLAPESSLETFSYLDGHHEVLVSAESIRVDAYDAVVLFDCGDVRRTHLAEKLFFLREERPPVALLDHHPSTTTFRDRDLVDLQLVDHAASSTCELVYRFLVANRIEITPSLATALLTGIITDTGGFTNLGTTHEALNVASELMRRGGNLRKIVAATLRSKTLGTLQLWGRALSRLEHDPVSGIVSTALTLNDFKECGVDREGSEGIANFLNSLGEGKAALVLREEPNEYVKGSFRTTRTDIDVAALARAYGGGGHRAAAGFTVHGKIERTDRGWTVVTSPSPVSATRERTRAPQP